MGLFSKEPTPQEVEAERARLEEEQRRTEEAARAVAAAAFDASPQGQARAARASGAGHFQTCLSVAATDHTDMAGLNSEPKTARFPVFRGETIDAIESEGWRLDHVGYVFRQTGSASKDKVLATGQISQVTGEIVGVYLFGLDATTAAKE